MAVVADSLRKRVTAELSSAPPSGYGAVSEFEQRVIAALAAYSPGPDIAMPTDAELSEATGLSHSTVRRGMRALALQGWVSRRPGLGNFTGPRVALGASTVARSGNGTERRVRAGVLLMFRGSRTWYDGEVLAGLDEAAADEGVALELIGGRPDDPCHVVNALQLSDLQVLISVSPSAGQMPVVYEATKMGIPTVLAGNRKAWEGYTAALRVDDVHGAALGVSELIARGHRRIGCVVYEGLSWWVFERRRGWAKALTAAGLTPDERLMHWVDLQRPAESADALAAYLEREAPTALFFGTASHVEMFGDVARRLGLRIPQDISVVVYDQHPEVKYWLGVEPTHVEQPLREIGREAVRAAVRLAAGKDVARETMFRCRLVEGGSVLDSDDS